MTNKGTGGVATLLKEWKKEKIKKPRGKTCSLQWEEGVGGEGLLGQTCGVGGGGGGGGAPRRWCWGQGVVRGRVGLCW